MKYPLSTQTMGVLASNLSLDIILHLDTVLHSFSSVDTVKVQKRLLAGPLSTSTHNTHLLDSTPPNIFCLF
jgi:hypothetical protein